MFNTNISIKKLSYFAGLEMLKNIEFEVFHYEIRFKEKREVHPHLLQ